MTTLVLRGTKGSALTFTELDDNFSNLDTDLATATTALGDYLPLAGGNITGVVDTTDHINIADDKFLAWGGGTGRPLIWGNKASNYMKFYIDGDARVAFTDASATFNYADVKVNSKISHNGDADNYLNFTTDTLSAFHGGTNIWSSTTTDINFLRTLDIDPSDNTNAMHARVDWTTGNQAIAAVTIDLNIAGNDTATDDRVHAGLVIDLDTSYTGGDTSEEGQVYGVKVNNTSSGDNDLMYGGYFLGQTSGTNAEASTQTSTIYGVFAQADHNRALLNANMYGVFGYSSVDNAGATGTINATNSSGVYGKHANQSGGTTGTVTNGVGVYAELECNEGVITNGKCYEAYIDMNAGTMTSAYLFRGIYGHTGGTIGTKWGIRTQGCEINRVEGQWQFDDGAVDVPIISNTLDANTGIYFPAGETIGFSCSAVERVRIAPAGLDVTGLITVSGTVDGRDIAADGTKLDTIATNATAYADADADARIAAADTNDLSEGSTNLYFTAARADARIAAADTDDLSEGSTNLYFTNARADARIAAADTDDLSEGTTNKYFTDARANARADAQIAAASTSDLSEGTNLYYTNARADARIAAASTSDLSEGTNLYYTDARANTRADAQIAAASTSDLSEGTNLYYTDARANARADAQIAAADTGDLSEGTNLYYTDARANARADARIAAADTGDLSEGTNLYYTDARANARADAQIAAADTGDLSEGTNLYYTNARADARIAAADTGDLSEGTNLYYTNARADARIAAADTADLSEGTNLYYTNARADARIAAASIFALTDVASGTMVANLNADKVDGFQGIGIYDLSGTLLNG